MEGGGAVYGGVVKPAGFRSADMGLTSRPGVWQLCNFRQITKTSPVPVSPSVKWEDNLHRRWLWGQMR